MQADHRKRRKVYDREGDAHFLTFSCYRRLPLFSKERTCQWMIDAIKLSRQKNAFDLWAWVIMPEHVHLVLLPRDGVRISSVLTTMKQSVSRRAMHWLRENAPEFLEQMVDKQPNGNSSHRFWQRGGGYDRNLRSTRDVHEKILYVHQNPVARGLKKNPEDYRWSSAEAWKSGSDEPISIDRGSVPTLSVTEDNLGSKLFG